MKYTLIVDKASEEEILIRVHSPSPLTQQIENLVRNYSGNNCIVGYADDEMKKLTFEEVECVTVIDRRVIAIDVLGKKYRIQGRLKDLEEVLPSYFLRINKSTIANEQRVLRFDAAFSGGVDAVFKCGYREYVSRRCFSEIRKRYKNI